MKKLILLCLILSSNLLWAETLYDFKFTDTNGGAVDFKDLKGKVVVIVNIATKCGFTGQLDDLEKLYTNYKDKNVAVIGIPSNNFLSQTPEDNKEVGNFCRLKYGVNFPITEKQEVIGDKIIPFFKWVHTQKGYESSIKWNFEKFIFDKNGKLVERFRSMTNPMDKEVTNVIDKLIK